MKQIPFLGLLLVLFFVALVHDLVGGPMLVGCTPQQRTVVRGVVDLVEDLCPEASSSLECLARLEIAMNAAPSSEAPPDDVVAGECRCPEPVCQSTNIPLAAPEGGGGAPP